MRVRPTDPAAVIRDPKSKRILPAEGGKVPGTMFWKRRVRDGSVVVEPDEDEAPAPTGREPVVPLTTRRPLPLPGVTPRGEGSDR